MKYVLMIFVGVLIVAAAFADASTNAPLEIAASKVRVKCTICKGRGNLKVSPPDH